MKFLVTGATGFLGSQICEFLSSNNIEYVGTTRSPLPSSELNFFETGDLLHFNDWKSLFSGVDVVVHAAAKAHDMSDSATSRDSYYLTNQRLTELVCTEAKKHGVRKFIYISSIKVNGEFTEKIPFKADDIVNPQDDYSKSKHLAEQFILNMNDDSAFSVTVIRPCLIYGRGVKANFDKLIKLINLYLPLPFASIKNKRSFISINNLIDLILNCAENPKASGQIFLASDGQDLSLPELITAIADAKKKYVFIFPFPVKLLKLLFRLLGLTKFELRLIRSLQVDLQKNKKILNWEPKKKTLTEINRFFS